MQNYQSERWHEPHYYYVWFEEAWNWAVANNPGRNVDTSNLPLRKTGGKNKINKNMKASKPKIRKTENQQYWESGGKND